MQPLDASSYNPREGGPSFPLRHRVYRMLWGVVWTLTGRWTPVPFHRWRRFLVKVFGADVHPTSKIYPLVDIWYPANLKMAEHSCLAPRSICYNMDRIELGAYALVSQGAHLCGGSHDVDDPNFQLYTKPIIIGANAWVAAEAFVGPGVTISEGAVLGARAVTMKDLDANTIYVGNPARSTRKRAIDGAVV